MSIRLDITGLQQIHLSSALILLQKLHNNAQMFSLNTENMVKVSVNSSAVNKSAVGRQLMHSDEAVEEMQAAGQSPVATSTS